MWLTFVVLLAVPADAPKEADQPLRRIEEKLSKAKSLHLDFDVQIVGPDGKGGTIKGTLDAQEGGKMRLELKGEGEAKKLNMLIVSDGKHMTATGAGPAKEPHDTPKKLDQLYRATVTRTGVVLPLFFAKPVPAGETPKEPDLDELFKVSDVKLGKKEKLNDKETQVVEYTIALKNSKDPLAVTLWLDPKTELPLKRVLKGKQGGEMMSITETYTGVTLDKKIDAKTFELPK